MRKYGWRTNLTTFLNEKKDEPFKWGTWDCGLRAAAVCDVILDTDIDYAEPFLGYYSTEIGSLRALKKAGYKDLKTYLKECFGKPVNVGQAWWGDIAWYEDCCGIFLGSFATFIGDERIISQLRHGDKQYIDVSSGIVRIPRNEIKEVFKVR